MANRFKQMTRPERKRFLRRKAERFGFQPPEFNRRVTARRAKKQNRAMNRQYWDTGDWATDPLTRRQVTSDAKAEARLKYRPVLRELRDELQGSARQQRNIDMGFDLYKKQLADLSARSAANARMATQQAFNQANTMSAGDAASAAQLDQQAQQSAAQRGATAAPDEASGQASRARQMLQSSFGALLANQGLASSNRFLQEEGIGDRQRIAEHAKERGYARDIKQKRRETKLDRGDFLRDYLAQGRENERRYTLERKAFGLEKQAQKADIRHQKRADKLALIEALAQARDEKRDDIRDRLKDKWDMTDDQIDNQLAQWKANHPNFGDKGDAGGPSDSVRMEAKEDWESALARARLITGDKKLSDLTVEQIAGNIERKTSAERIIALAAAQKAKRGYVSGSLAKKLRRRYGLKVGGGKPSRGGVTGDILSGAESIRDAIVG